MTAAHSYRSAGRIRSMKGTVVEQIASAHSGPFVLNSRNWMYQAPNATRKANTNRHGREFGDVSGSENMKKVKSSRAPFWRRGSGMVIGSPSQIERPKTSVM